MFTDEEFNALKGNPQIQPPMAELVMDPVKFVETLTGYLKQLQDFYTEAVNAQSQYIDNDKDPDCLDPIIESVQILTQTISRLVNNGPVDNESGGK